MRGGLPGPRALVEHERLHVALADATAPRRVLLHARRERAAGFRDRSHRRERRRSPALATDKEPDEIGLRFVAVLLLDLVVPDDPVHQRALRFDDFVHPIIDRVGNVQIRDRDGARLPDTVDAVFGLLLVGRRPETLHENRVCRAREREPFLSGFRRDDHAQLARLKVLGRLPARLRGRFAVDHAVGDTGRFQRLGDPLDHRLVCREDHDVLPFRHQPARKVDRGLRLDPAHDAAKLAHLHDRLRAQRRFRLRLRARAGLRRRRAIVHALTRKLRAHAVLYGLFVPRQKVLFGVHVRVALRRRHGHLIVDALLLREVFQRVFLLPADHRARQPLLQRPHVLDADVLRAAARRALLLRDVGFRERLTGAPRFRVQRGQQRVKLNHHVLDRRAGQQDAVRHLLQHGDQRFRALRAGVLRVVRLVRDHTRRPGVDDLVGVRDQHFPRHNADPLPPARRDLVVVRADQHARDGRHPLCGFAHPVDRHVFRRDDHGGQQHFGVGDQASEPLNRLSKARRVANERAVVGQLRERDPDRLERKRRQAGGDAGRERAAHLIQRLDRVAVRRTFRRQLVAQVEQRRARLRLFIDRAGDTAVGARDRFREPGEVAAEHVYQLAHALDRHLHAEPLSVVLRGVGARHAAPPADRFARFRVFQVHRVNAHVLLRDDALRRALLPLHKLPATFLGASAFARLLQRGARRGPRRNERAHGLGGAREIDRERVERRAD